MPDNPAASSPEVVRELYEASADWYAKIMDEEINLPIYADLLERLASDVRNLHGAVVDTSCGPGHMLALYGSRFDPDRQLVGIDLSPAMVRLATDRLPESATTLVGDMQDLETIRSDSVAGILSFFALHHLSADSVEPTLREWARALISGGRLLLATWEGNGCIDYGEDSDVVALRFTQSQIVGWMEAAGFTVNRCSVEPVAGMEMNAIYAEGALG